MQSLRLRQGPVQRRLGLMTLEVDAAGKRVAAIARDRDAAEAEQLLLDLALACQRARGAGPPPSGRRRARRCSSSARTAGHSGAMIQ